jgi:hypothetical protein
MFIVTNVILKNIIHTYDYVLQDTCTQRCHTVLHCLQKTQYIFLNTIPPFYYRSHKFR